MDLNSQQIHVDSTDEEIVARVAAIVVTKDLGMVCTRVPDQSQPGKRTTSVWNVRVRTNAIIELAERGCWSPRLSTAALLLPVRSARPGGVIGQCL